ncbi:MAG: beta-lactamase family protein [Pseudonocardia sp.]|nr:beta-lactamase family protein [Pseudonocardia sp.]
MPSTLPSPQPVLSPYLANGSVPGLVWAVAHGDDVRVEAHGSVTPGGAPMRRDTIFRISSMTKPMTAVAAMTLVEDGTLALDDAVDRWLPELADRRVLRRDDAQLDDTVPASRPITVEDLFTFRLGIGVMPVMPAAHPIQHAFAEARLGGDGPPGSHDVPAADEWMRRLGELPLIAQPGERWLYHTGADVLGVLIARASGMSLGAFLAERVFGPLGMRDTGFHVPAGSLHRFGPELVAADDGLEVFDAVDGRWSAPPAFESGGGGLVSTVDDILAFARMLRDGGGSVLSAAGVTRMTTDRLTPEQQAGAGLFLDGEGWGLGMAVAPDGRYGWDGGLGTSWRTDPATDVIDILLTPVMWSSPAGPEMVAAFRRSLG